MYLRWILLSIRVYPYKSIHNNISIRVISINRRRKHTRLLLVPALLPVCSHSPCGRFVCPACIRHFWQPALWAKPAVTGPAEAAWCTFRTAHFRTLKTEAPSRYFLIYTGRGTGLAEEVPCSRCEAEPCRWPASARKLRPDWKLSYP